MRNINDTLTYITGLGAGYAGINAIPAAASGQWFTALIGLITVIFQALIMKWAKHQDKSNVDDKVDNTKALLDLQKQIIELKSKQDADNSSFKS